MQRVMDRDGITEEAFMKRRTHQMPEEEKTGMADHVIANDGDRFLIPQVIELHDQFAMQTP
jgi:dephospho-CoA kinase